MRRNENALFFGSFFSDFFRHCEVYIIRLIDGIHSDG